MTHKSALFLLITLTCGSAAAAQIGNEPDQRLSFRCISVNDGLSQNSVTSILQDKDGIMMIATYDGMNFYDGYRITSERYSSSRPDGLSNNRIVCMEPCGDGTIWIGLDGGLMRYDPDRRSYVNYTDLLGMLRSFWVRSIDSDKTGGLWIGTTQEIVRGEQLDDGSFRFSVVQGIPAATVNALKCDPQDNTWAGTAQGAYRLSPRGDGSVAVHRIATFTGRNVTSVFCDRDTAVWIGYDGGLAVKPRNGEIFREIPQFKELAVRTNCLLQGPEGEMWIGTDKKGLFRAEFEQYRLTAMTSYSPDDFFGRLSDDNIASLFIDNSGVLWVGTGRGINYADLSAPRFYSFKPLITERYNELGYMGKHIHSLYIDSRSQLWISIYQEGLVRYDLKSGEIHDMSSITPFSIAEIIEDRQGGLWFAAQDAVYRVECEAGSYRGAKIELGTSAREARKHFRYYSGLCEDNMGCIWIATVNGLIRYDPRTKSRRTFLRSDGLASDSPYCLLAERERDVIWAGFSDHGVTKIAYDRQGIVSTELLCHRRTPHTISHNQVWCLFRGGSDRLWIGTDAGLNRIDTRNGNIRSVTHVNAPYLSNAKIQAITADARGTLWLNSSQGLYSYNPDSGVVRRYICDDGLQSNTFTNAATTSPDGWVFTGGINGVNYFNPGLFKENGYAGKPIVTDLRIFNKTIEPGKEYDGRTLLERTVNATDRVTLNYKQNNFVLEFTCDHYVSPQKNRFRYKLEGYDKEWTEAGASHRYASYENLPAGEYEFMLCSSNNDGVWSDRLCRKQFVILRPPWKSWWAYLLYAVTSGLLITAVISYFRSRQRWKQMLFRREMEQRNGETLNEMKLNFYTNITHELRTPLTLISAPLRDLCSAYKDDEYMGFRLGIIDRNAKKLLKLINQLLDIRRISAQTLPMVVSCRDVHNTVRDVVSSFGYLAEQSGIYLRYLPPAEARKGWFDHDKIEKVLHNLLSNAFKFTSKGGNIEVRLWFECLDEREFARVCVSDSGVGIPQKELAKIFDLFYHGTPLAGQSSGVGLSLTKALLELHGGRVEVKSTPNAGSEFTASFRIDCKAYDPAYVIREDAASGAPAGSGDDTNEQNDRFRVLVVEDNDDMRNYICVCLKKDFHITMASDGRTGLELARSKHPDIVITDMMMPVMDGMEFIRSMKRDSRTDFIPIIVHSIKNDKTSIREAFKAGAQEYIVKPFEPETLILRITNQLSSRVQFARKVKTEKIMEPTGVQIPAQDEELLNRIRTIVENNMSNVSFGVDQLACELGMSRTQLYRRAKTIPPGKNPNEIIRDIRIQRAGQLLATGQLRVVEVLYEIGITNHYRFVQYFKNTYAMTPKEYIRKFNKDAVDADSE